VSSSTPDRFARTAERLAALQDERAAALAERVAAFVLPRGDERALDVGAGAGALALALAPLVREVVGVDRVPELLELARERARGLANVAFVEGDAESLPFEDGSFDLVGTLRTLHHVPRPELVVAELVRVTRPGGLILVVDQIAPIDPLEAIALDRFERTRDPGHTRLLPDIDLRQLFEANELVLLRDRHDPERRELAAYLDLAGCEGEARAQALALAPNGPEVYLATLGWYLLRQRAAERPSHT
jgi:SAM-dependent methyltransferase